MAVASRTTLAATTSLQTVTNLKWDHPMDHRKKSDVDQFGTGIMDLILKKRPSGSESLYLFKAHTPAGLAKAFPSLSLERYDASGTLGGLLRAVRLPEGLRIAFDLQDSATEWWAAVVPGTSWQDGIESIEAYIKRPTPEQRFGLTCDAARLFEWIETREKKDMLGSWTPVVEPVIASEIGITSQWPEENIPALLQMLADEITEKTNYRLGLQPWKEHGQVRTRIKVGQKASDHESFAQKVARAAMEIGIGLTEDQVQKMASVLSASA